MPHPDQQIDHNAPTLADVARKHGFTFKDMDLKLRFDKIVPPVKRDVPPAPPQRDLPKPAQRPQPVDIPRLLNDAMLRKDDSSIISVREAALADRMMFNRSATEGEE